MRLLSYLRRKPLRQLRVAGLIAVMMFAGATSMAQGLGLRFWDDSNNNGGQCDVLNAFGTANKCTDNTYNLALVATMTVSVPKGNTTVHIVYDLPNSALDSNGNPDPNAALFGSGFPSNSQLHFDIQGDSWCPTYTGSPGVNSKDSANGGKFADSNDLPTSALTAGSSEVTDFVMNENDGSERQLSNTGLYRVGSTQCDSSGTGYTKVVNVQAADLRHQAGFPPNVWYAEMLARPSESLKVNGDNQTRADGSYINCSTAFYDPSCNLQCSAGFPNNCEGISNKFRVVLNTSETGAAYYDTVSGSSIAATGNDYNVSFTNNSINFASGIQQDVSKHYSAVYRFGADCSVLRSNGPLPSHVLFYDIDDAGTGNDIQKALLVKISNGNTYTLGSGGYYQGRTIGATGNWHNRTDPSSGSYVPNWSQSYTDTDTTRIDSQVSNQYWSANFNANVGDQYKLYIYDIRGDLVDQIGAPFDSVYFNNPCTASINPGVGMTLASGSQYTAGSVVNADANIANPGNVNVTADWTREYWITPVQASADTSFGAGDTRIHPQATGTRTVAAGNTANSTDGSSFGGGTWQYTIPPTALNGSWICTSLNLNPNTLDPINTDIVGAGNPAVTCHQIINSAYPYYSIRGGDIVAGPGINNNGVCTEATPGTADIIGHNVNASPYSGSSSQLAALALDNIKAFSTGNAQTGNLQTGSTTWVDAIAGAPSPPSALAFSNDPSLITGSTYGGKLGINSGWCADDYYTAASSSGATSKPSGTSVTGLAAGVNVYSGAAGSTMTLAGGILPAQNSVLKVNGNVYITGNAAYTAGSISNPPFLEIVATGNIYIDPTVTRIDGFLAARGAIITCANGSGAIALSGSLGVCNRQLVINGAVAAKEFIPNRNDGDVLNQQDTESPAEIIQYSPQIWLPSIGSGGSIGQWDAVTSLPPIL